MERSSPLKAVAAIHYFWEYLTLNQHAETIAKIPEHDQLRAMADLAENGWIRSDEIPLLERLVGQVDNRLPAGQPHNIKNPIAPDQNSQNEEGKPQENVSSTDSHEGVD